MSCSRCDLGNKGLRRKVGLVPNTAWEGVTDGKVESLHCRVVEMFLGSHFMTGVAILEQSKDSLVGDSGHVCWGGDAANGSYLCY